MRVLFLIPGGAEAQLQALPMAAALAEGGVCSIAGGLPCSHGTALEVAASCGKGIALWF